MTDETINTLIKTLPAILTAIPAIIAAVFAGLAFRRSGKNAEAIEAMRQEQRQ